MTLSALRLAMGRSSLFSSHRSELIFSAGLNPQPTYFPVIRETRAETHGASRSGSNVLQVPPPGIDFAPPALLGILAKPQASISLWVRNVTTGAFKTGLQLRAFDTNGKRVDRNGSAYASVASGSTGYTRLTATSATTNIASFLLLTRSFRLQRAGPALVDGRSEPRYTA